MFPDIEGSSQKMLLLTERNKLCKGLFIINNLQLNSKFEWTLISARLSVKSWPPKWLIVDKLSMFFVL